MVFVTLALIVAAVVLSELLRKPPKFEDAKPATLSDFDGPTATEGRKVPLLVGTVLAKGANLVWYDDLRQDPIREKIKTGLFSSTRVTKGFKYYLGQQAAFCRGPGVKLTKFFLNEKEVYSSTVSGPEGRFDVDEPELFGGDDLGSGGFQATIDFYSGEKTQPVNAYLDHADRQRITTAATPTAPRYTRTCHMVIRELTSAAPTSSDRGAYIGNSKSLPQPAAELQRIPGLFSGQTSGQNIVNLVDANPVNAIYELLTDKEWGYKQSSSSIDVGSSSTFKKASDTMIAEGNGFSMFVDREMERGEYLRILEEQIEGVVYQDPETGLWSIQLIRGPDDASWGYDINTVPQITNDDIASIKEFARGDWEDTVNEVEIEFSKRVDNYKLSYAAAQDMANAILLAAGSTTNPESRTDRIRFPGVKDEDLANNIAWRELRARAYPLMRATLVLDRKVWDLKRGTVFAWTDSEKGFTKLPMRVLSVDFGLATDRKMTVRAVQDIFFYEQASGGSPGASKWTEPTTALVAYPSDEQVAFEAPRALLIRDPDYADDDSVSKVWAGARRQGGEVAIQIKQRNAVGSPAGSYAEAGTIVGFIRIGSLDADLDAGQTLPVSAITINPSPDSQTALLEVFDGSTTLLDLGVDLTQLVLVGSEFMLVRGASANGADVDLDNVYRGALDSVQGNHSAGDDVYLVFVGGNITETTFPDTYNVDIELRMRSAQETFSGSVTAISLTMQRRARRPYPPSSPRYNSSGSQWNTPNLEANGSGLNGVGFDIEWWRRRFDATNEVDELLADKTVDASTEYRVRVYVDPTGGNDLAFDSGWVTGAGPVTPTQAEIATYGAAGTELRITIETRHDIDSLSDLEALQTLTHDVTPTSTRTSQFYLGGDLGALATSNAYAVVNAGVHNVNIGAAYSSANVEARINGGAWSTIIAAGNTTGATASLSVSDTIELRVSASDTPDPQFVEIDDGTNPVAYGVFSA